MDPIKTPARLILVSSSPHIHCGSTVSAAMRDVLLALVPVTLSAVWFFRLEAVTVILACCLSAVFFEALCQKVMGCAITVKDGSALLTGLLLALCLPPGLSPMLAVFGSFCAIVIGKQVFGGLGNNIFNPAHIGRAILLASMPQQMTTWLPPVHSFIDNISNAFGSINLQYQQQKPLTLLIQQSTRPLQPLRSASMPSVQQLLSLCCACLKACGKKDKRQTNCQICGRCFSEIFRGSLGETCVPAILLGGLFLIWRGHVDWRAYPSIICLPFSL